MPGLALGVVRLHLEVVAVLEDVGVPGGGFARARLVPRFEVAGDLAGETGRADDEPFAVLREQLAVHPEPAPTAYDKLQQDVGKAMQSAESRPEAVDGVSFGLGMTNGYFSTLAEGKTLRPDIREYYLAMLRRVNEKWWVARNGQTGRLRDAIIDVVVARDGTVVYFSLARSSGDPAWDKIMLKSLESASPLPPLPESYTDEFFRAPLRFVAPLNLMAPTYSGTPGGNDHSDSSGSNSSRSRS